MLSIPDMALLGAAALMFFGPEQLPKVARKVGLLVRDVQNTSQSFIREMERAGDDYSYNPDISRAHLLEDPVPPRGPLRAAGPRSVRREPYAGENSYADHPYAPKEASSPIHDVMPPRAPSSSAAGDHELPP